jgi:spore coat protein U-like protein
MDRSSTRGGRRAAPLRFAGNRLNGNLLFPILAALTILWPAVFCRAESSTLSVTATVLSKSICKFNSNNSALNFGALDPGNPIDVTANASIGFVCRGSSPVAVFAIAGDAGFYSNGPNANRMRHSSVFTEYLPYSLALDPSSGTVPKNAPQTLTISGTVQGSDYQNATAGGHSDTVVVSLLP